MMHPVTADLHAGVQQVSDRRAIEVSRGLQAACTDKESRCQIVLAQRRERNLDVACISVIKSYADARRMDLSQGTDTVEPYREILPAHPYLAFPRVDAAVRHADAMEIQDQFVLAHPVLSTL
jgi:hypothetical protein